MSVSFAQFDATEIIEKMNTGYGIYKGKLGGRDMKVQQGINAAAAVVTLRLSLSAILEDYLVKTCDIGEAKVNSTDAMKTCIKKLIEAKISGQGLKWQIDGARMDADEIYKKFMIAIESSPKLEKEMKKQCALLFAQVELKRIISQADARNGNEEQEFLKEEEKMMAMKKEMKCRIELARLHKRQEVEKEIIRLHKRQGVEKEIIRLYKRQEAEKEIIRLHDELDKKELCRELAALKEELKKKELRKELAALKEELKKKELRKELAALKEELKKKELRRAAC